MTFDKLESTEFFLHRMNFLCFGENKIDNVIAILRIYILVTCGILIKIRNRLYDDSMTYEYDIDKSFYVLDLLHVHTTSIQN